MSKRDVHNLVKARLATLADETAPSASAARPATPMGDAGAELKRSLQTQIADLKAQLASGAVILELDPSQVRATDLANRDARSLALTDEHFAALVEDIRSVGCNRLPIEVRPAPAGSGFDFEIVSGHRRHAACRELGIKVRAIVVSAADTPERLFQLLHRENSVRANPSYFEYGVLYRAALNAKIFATQKELAESAGVAAQHVSLCLSILELPEIIHQAFGDPRAITLGQMQKLAKPLKERPAELQANARDIVAKGQSLDGDLVLNLLLAGRAKGGSAAPRPYEQTLRLADNKTVFAKVKSSDWKVEVVLGTTVRDPKLRQQLIERVERATRETLDRHENADE